MDERIAEAADRFGIADALDQKVGGYSTGMRARLALARAVLHEPDLLLLDEPTAGLDPESARTVLGLIDEMAEDGKTVLMCTHLLLEAEGLADQVIVMDHGQGDDLRLAARAHPPVLARGTRRARRRRSRRCSTARRRCRSCAAYHAQRRRHRRARRTRPTSPISSTRSSAPARASRASSRRHRRSKSCTSPSAGSTSEPSTVHPPAPSVVGDRPHRPAPAAAGARLLAAADDRGAALLRHHPDLPAAHPRVGEGRQPGQQAERRRRKPPEEPPGERARAEGSRERVRTRWRCTCSHRSRSSCR